MNEPLQTQLNELFSQYLERYVPSNYQKQIFEKAWGDYCSNNLSQRLEIPVKALLSKQNNYDLIYIARIVLILTFVDAGILLLNSPDDFSSLKDVNPSLISLTAGNFTGVLPQLIISNLSQSDDARLKALEILADFLAKFIYPLGTKTSDPQTIYMELIHALCG